MNIFIDTNILLGFYQFSSGFLEELRKVAKLSGTEKIRLFLSDYVKDEFDRNREAAIKASLDRFKSIQLDWALPHIVRTYPQYKEIKRLKKEIERAKGTLLEAVERDIQKASLLADIVIAELFDSTEVAQVSEDILKAGIERSYHSKPPGKAGSCGDAVHWEWLLKTVPNKEDLFIISGDSDFVSPLPPHPLSRYLSDEWKRKKASKCVLYPTLADFLKKHFPEIKIADEAEKEAFTKPSELPWPFADRTTDIANAIRRLDEAMRNSPAMADTMRVLEQAQKSAAMQTVLQIAALKGTSKK